MIPKKRIRLSAMQRVEVWRCWKAGESLHAIGRALGKNNVVIHLLLKRHGGIAPPIRRRSPSSLTLAEREDISRGIACGSSIRGIAQGLHRCPRRSAGKWPAMAGARSTAPMKPISPPGNRPCGPSRACWPLTPRYSTPTHNLVSQVISDRCFDAK